ncbi:hypothetical protein [Bosea sp. (in: a-proteobacteria)]|uniref:hypothetical protein n=1 Tax=Bosea sp. (in: a-proteobacteria) TaxID=1871050 RepID=UPI002B47AB8F|nr:hypothetical protein [Bosea sp. (in: a-proteobacteria)]WRH57258.1 MAG: hypothetical protein RSE11_20000 [Bosea sp. (in: a-proteobacteria)]
MEVDKLKLMKNAEASTEGSYIPPFSDILDALGISKEEYIKNGVMIPAKVLNFLIAHVLIGVKFDEASYLRQNPDVALGVRAGSVESGWGHFISTGYFEGRSTGTTPLDENFYRRRYPDVASAERRGLTKIAEHYAQTGIIENRAPNEFHEKLATLWKVYLSPDTN